MQEKPPLKERTVGRWRDILTSFGVSPQLLTGKHGPCPICGGKDRFRYDNKQGNGTWFCNHCGAGDGVKLVMEVNGWDFATAAKNIEEVLGDTKYDKPKPDTSDKLERAMRRKVYSQSHPIKLSDPAGKYLLKRCGPLKSFPKHLRAVDKLLYFEDDKKSFHPGMIAIISDPDGRPVNIHRTYLSEDGSKANLTSPRKMMKGNVPTGSAVRLFPYDEALGIAEGIETAISASLMFKLPVWSAIDAGKMMDWIPPKNVKRVIVFGDNDPTYTGQAAAYTLANRLVVKEGLSVEVMIPEVDNSDWNDLYANVYL